VTQTQKPTILLVDDSADDRAVLAEFLRHSGFLPVEAGNPEDALRLAEASPPAAIVADLHLPGWMNGLELAHRLKRGVTTRDVPVVMVTGMARDHDRKLAASAGIDAFFRKPCSPAELVRELRRLIDARK
jgi:CheY-like chemotaxis protein